VLILHNLNSPPPGSLRSGDRFALRLCQNKHPTWASRDLPLHCSVSDPFLDRADIRAQHDSNEISSEGPLSAREEMNGNLTWFRNWNKSIRTTRWPAQYRYSSGHRPPQCEWQFGWPSGSSPYGRQACP